MNGARRRLRTYATVVSILVALIATLGTFGGASAVKIPPPGGGGGGSCPAGTIAFSVSTTTTYNSANLVIGVNVAGADVTVQWGTTTSYGHSTTYDGAPVSFSVYIGSLSSYTKYYYQVTGTESCYNSGSFSGSFTTANIVYSTITGSPGYDGASVVYLTDYAPGQLTAAASTVAEQSASGSQVQSVHGVGNSVALQLLKGSGLTATYYQFNLQKDGVGCNCLKVYLTFAGAGRSQLYDEGLWNHYTEDLKLSTNILGMPSSSGTVVVQKQDEQVNITNPGQRAAVPNWAGFTAGGVTAGLALAAWMAPESEGLSFPAYGAALAAAGVAVAVLGAASEFPSSGSIQNTPDLQSTGSPGPVIQYFETTNGTMGYCAVLGSCSYGQNWFSGLEQVEFTIYGPFTGISGDLVLGASNTLGAGECPYPDGDCGTASTGASAQLTIPLVPAYGIGGQVTTSSGAPASDATVTISCQTYSSGTYFDTSYVETADSSGYWHFYGNVGQACSYYATLSGYSPSVTHVTTSAETAAGVDTEGLSLVV